MDNMENKNFEQPEEEHVQDTQESKSTKKANAKAPIYKKWWFWVIIGIVVIAILAGGGDSGSNTDNQGGGSISNDANNNDNQGNGSANNSSNNKNNLGEYNVVIESCRLATDYSGEKCVIVKYSFTNNSDNNAAFYVTIEDNVFQNDIGLNKAYILPDEANYSGDNQSKEIRPGATIDVEVAYTLNDSTSPIEVEITEYFSFSDRKVTKTFTIN